MARCANCKHQILAHGGEGCGVTADDTGKCPCRFKRTPGGGFNTEGLKVGTVPKCGARRTRPVNGKVRYEQCVRVMCFGDEDHDWAEWTPDPGEMAMISPQRDSDHCPDCQHFKTAHGESGCRALASGSDCNCARSYCPGCGTPPEANHADDCSEIPPWMKLKCLRCNHPAGAHASELGCLADKLGRCDCTRRASQGYAPDVVFWNEPSVQCDVRQGYAPDVAFWNEPSVQCDVRRGWGNGKVTQCTLGSPHHGRDHDFPYPDTLASASDRQVGGNHYKDLKIQPWDIWEAYGLDAFTGAVIKYLLRDKGNRLEDLKKARHTLDKLIELEERKAD